LLLLYSITIEHSKPRAVWLERGFDGDITHHPALGGHGRSLLKLLRLGQPVDGKELPPSRCDPTTKRRVPWEKG
jgi:hypothetical protein